MTPTSRSGRAGALATITAAGPKKSLGVLASRAAEGGLVLAGAAALYALAAGAERLLDASPIGAALIEEALKALVIVGSGLLGLRRALRESAEERGAGRRARAGRLGAARGLSRGLAAVALFAAAENVAYFAAAPETGVFARFLWSTPVHLASALALALGSAPLLFAAADARTRPRGASHIASRNAREAAFLAPLGGLAAAVAWHAAANAIASGSPGPLVLAAGSAASIAAALALGRAFIAKAYIGGFIHGPQEED